MFIHITPDELETEFRESWKLGWISHPSIDYADNAIYAIFENKQVIIFRFKNYGWINDNRYNSYLISSGSAGITIQIKSNDRNKPGDKIF
jgi:hypothetical protein